MQTLVSIIPYVCMQCIQVWAVHAHVSRGLLAAFMVGTYPRRQAETGLSSGPDMLV